MTTRPSHRVPAVRFMNLTWIYHHLFTEEATAEGLLRVNARAHVSAGKKPNSLAVGATFLPRQRNKAGSKLDLVEGIWASS